MGESSSYMQIPFYAVKIIALALISNQSFNAQKHGEQNELLKKLFT